MITIGYDFENKEILTNGDYIVNEDESLILSGLYEYLFCDPEDLQIVANSKDYTTLQYKDVDLVRVKCTNNTQWIKILIANQVLKEDRDNPLFDLQKNKNESMWKCRLEDINDLHPYINSAIAMIDSWNN